MSMKMEDNTQLLDGIDSKIHMNGNGNGKVGENKEKMVSRISVFDHIYGKEYENSQAECFIVDMEQISQLMEKDISANNSGITLQRNLSRKSSQRGGEKKTNGSVGNEKDANFVFSSPRAPLSPLSQLSQGGVGTIDKPMVVKMGTTLSEVPKQNSPMANNGSLSSDNKFGGKRFSFKGSASSSWGIHPRKILFLSATLSCIGTILLICLTLAMAKTQLDDNVALE